MRSSLTKVVALAFAMASLSPVAGMAATKAPAKAKAAVTVVTGKIVSIDAGLSMVTLSNGQTYRVTDAAKFKAMKVGQTVKLRMAEKKA